MLSWEYPPHIVGGLGQHVTELVPSLAALGIEVHLLTPRWVKAKSREEFASARVYRVPSPRGELTDYYQASWKANLIFEDHARRLWESSGGFSLIHAHDWLVGFAACALKRRFSIPLVSTIHATEMGRAGGELQSAMQKSIHDVEWWLTYESERVICASQFMAQEVKNHFQVAEEKLRVIPNGVRSERFQLLFSQNPDEFRNRFAAKEEPLVLFVGRLVQEKGAQILVEAAPLVLAQYPKVKFIITGTGSMEQEIKKRVLELGVTERFVFTGFISDEERDQLYKVADLCVFPSLYEPFGIVALEAMAAGTPVVVSEVGGLAEVVRHSETGIFVHPGSPGSLAWGIMHTLEHPQFARMRAAAAYQIAAAEYNWEHIAARTVEVYQEALSGGKGGEW